VPASTAKAAAKEAERKVPAVASPAKPATKEPDRKLAAATGAPKPAAKEPERKAAPAKPAPSAPAPSQSGEAPTQGGGFWSDQGLTLRVQSKLQFSRMWDSNSGIVVAVRNGVVTLTGTVPERGDIAEAGRLAASVAGVKSVRNELKVGPAK
jgi:hypothetical protein